MALLLQRERDSMNAWAGAGITLIIVMVWMIVHMTIKLLWSNEK